MTSYSEQNNTPTKYLITLFQCVLIITLQYFVKNNNNKKTTTTTTILTSN